MPKKADNEELFTRSPNWDGPFPESRPTERLESFEVPPPPRAVRVRALQAQLDQAEADATALRARLADVEARLQALEEELRETKRLAGES